MGKDLQDLWILMQEGTVVFKQVFDEKVDSQLFGGFMSALNSFASQISQDGLNNFELGDKRFYLVKKNGMMFIANSRINVKVKNAIKELESIIDRFFKMFPPEILSAWNGDLSFFDSFKVDIKDSFEDPVEKMKSSLW
jgi:hypothetical protein